MMVLQSTCGVFVLLGMDILHIHKTTELWGPKRCQGLKEGEGAVEAVEAVEAIEAIEAEPEEAVKAVVIAGPVTKERQEETRM